VRREHHVLALEHRVVGRQRLVVVHVERRDAGSPGGEGLLQRRHVDEGRARGVHQDGVLAHQREALGIEELACRLRRYQVEAHHLGRRQQVVQRHGLGTAFGRALGRHARAPGDDLHAEGLPHPRHALADVAQADDAQALPSEHLRQAPAIAPASTPQQGHVGLHALGRREDQGPVELRGRRLRIAHLRVGYRNAARGERGHVELRVAPPREHERAEVRHLRQQVRLEGRAVADEHDRVRVLHHGEERVAPQALGMEVHVGLRLHRPPVRGLAERILVVVEDDDAWSAHGVAPSTIAFTSFAAERFQHALMSASAFVLPITGSASMWNLASSR
jgi:hypothetical protein